MKTIYTLLMIVLLGGVNISAQNMTSYDLNPGTPGTTPVPKGAVWDAVANEPLLKFTAGSYYVEATYSELEAFRNGSVTLADFWVTHSIKLNSTTTGQPLQLFRTVLDFSATKGIFITQANTTTAKNYIYKTNGQGLLTGNPSSQLILDDLDLMDSVGTVRGHIRFKDKIVISAGTPAYGIELMVLDSNYNATIIDINTTGNADAMPQQIFNWGDSVILFQATDGANGVELWRSNGTTGGTMMVKDINAGGSSSPEKFYAHGGKVYFSADNGSGTELWVTDGTNGGTLMVANLNGSDAATPNNFTSGPGGMLYFAASDGAYRQLYKTDGTTIGTTKVSTSVRPAPFSHEYKVTGNYMYFPAREPGDTIIHLYRTDGTSGGTELFYRIYSGTTPGYGFSNSFIMAENNGYIYFTGDDSLHSFEIYRTDGSTTIRATDFAQATGSYNYPNYLTSIPGGGVFFFGNDSMIGNELRVLDIGLSVGANTPEVRLVGRVYPNPTQGELTIELASGSYSLSLVDMTGRVISTQTLNVSDGNARIQRPNGADQPGIYFLIIQDQEGVNQTLKVVYY